MSRVMKFAGLTIILITVLSSSSIVRSSQTEGKTHYQELFKKISSRFAVLNNS